MIEFPKPFNWFQYKLWRIYWVEWYIIMFIFTIKDKLSYLQYHHQAAGEFFSNLLYTLVLVLPLSALFMVFMGKYMVKALFGFTRLMSSFFGAEGFVHGMTELLETLMWIVIDINYRIISKVSKEKLPIDPADKFAQKMGWT